MATQAVIRGAPFIPSSYHSTYPLKNIRSEACKPVAPGQDSLFPDMKPEQEVFDV